MTGADDGRAVTDDLAGLADAPVGRKGAKAGSPWDRDLAIVVVMRPMGCNVASVKDVDEGVYYVRRSVDRDRSFLKSLTRVVWRN